MKITTLVLFSISGFFLSGCTSAQVGRVENFALSPVSSTMAVVLKPLDSYNAKRGFTDFDDCYGEQFTVVNETDSLLTVYATSPHSERCSLTLSPRGTPYKSLHTFVLNPIEFAGAQATFMATNAKGSATFFWTSQRPSYNDGYAGYYSQPQKWEIRPSDLH